jgi:hypothetical protein
MKGTTAMARIDPARDASLYLLRDHLDAALGMGEDLLTQALALDTPASKSPLRTWMRQNRDLNAFLTGARTLEYAITSRLLQARKRAEELKRRDSRVKPLVALFVAGTAPLVDAAAELGDTDTRDFGATDAALTFLRSRGLLAPDAACLEGLNRISVGEDYQLAARIRLGTLMDLVATFLDTLDLLFDIPGEHPDDVAARPAPQPGEAPAETGHPA